MMISASVGQPPWQSPGPSGSELVAPGRVPGAQSRVTRSRSEPERSMSDMRKVFV